MSNNELLDEKVIEQRGSWQRVRRWWRGVHADKGAITRGWTGLETVEERDRILPFRTFLVKDRAA
jgi:hypothetical protein